MDKIFLNGLKAPNNIRRKILTNYEKNKISVNDKNFCWQLQLEKNSNDKCE